MCKLLGAALDAAVALALGIEPRDPRAPLFQQDDAFCMGLLLSLKGAVYFDEDAETVGLEPWVAGFNLRIEEDDRDYTYGSGSIALDHGARGETPTVAICRSIVQRAEGLRRAAELEMARRAADAENRRRTEVFNRAHERAWQMIMNRKATTVFESDEDKAVYTALIERHHALQNFVSPLPPLPDTYTPFLSMSFRAGGTTE